MLLIALTLLSSTEAARILGLFPHPGRSHHMVFEPLLRELTERNHELNILSFFPMALPKPTYRDISLEGLTRIQMNVVELQNFEKPFLGYERFNHFLDLQSMKPVQICEKLVEWPTVQELFNTSVKFDVILMENFNSDCVLGIAHLFDAPIIGLTSHVLIPWTADRLGIYRNPAYAPAQCVLYNDEMNLLERFENTAISIFYNLWFRFMIQKKEQEIWERKFGYRIPDFSEIAKRTHLVLTNTHFTLNGAYPTVPGIIEVGGMHLENNPTSLSEDLEQFLSKSKHGVILFSLGSMVKTTTLPEHRLQAFLQVFRKLKQRIIWKWEGDPPAGKPKNVLLAKWVPQNTLLNHPKVIAFIAHGGLLGLTEGVNAGVPMLIIPFFGDQPGNAASARKVGVARILPYTMITEDNLMMELKIVLSPEMRLRAKQFSITWSDRPRPPLEEAVYWIERAARLKGEPLTSPGRDVPTYQAALLDVAALFVLLVLALLFIVYLIFKGTFRILLFFINICCLGKQKLKKS